MIVVIGLCVVATTVALKLEFTAEMPTTLISFAIIFPVVFAINASYRRREQALGYFGDIKGHSMALFYAHRDWLVGEKSDFVAHSRDHILRFFESQMFASTVDQVVREAQLARLASRVMAMSKAEDNVKRDIATLNKQKLRLMHRETNRSQLNTISGVLISDKLGRRIY